MSATSDGSAESSADARRLEFQLSLNTSRDDALEAAIKAAERSMQALRLSTDANEKTKLSQKVKSLLDEAETIKQNDDWKTALEKMNKDSASTTKARELKQPESKRKLSTREQILLLNASFLHGFKFPPWTSPPEASEFELQDGEQLFLDTQDLPLSDFQEDVFDGWKRPIDALPPPTWNRDPADSGPGMRFPKKIDLVQDAATDCSVVASLCAGVSRFERGHSPLLRSLFYPFDAETAKPVISKSGKYVVRLNFNGCYRKVTIDDRLPTSSTNRIIHVVDRNNPGLLWPALLEKAYLKVRGGYDFPGSNSATDLWILTGWIPEQIFLQSDELEPGRFWRRISNAFEYGDVLITMGTGKISTRAEREFGLAGEHDYAVLDLKDIDGHQLFLVKNPWCEGASWHRYTEEDEQESNHQRNAHDADRNPRDVLNGDKQLSAGTFWMSLDDVIQHFESIYLNWNPGLFVCREDVHFSWDLSRLEGGGEYPRGKFGSLTRHPQYTCAANKGGVVWVLLWRHFQNAVPADATPEEIEENRYGIELSGHMSLAAFSSSGHRVLLPDKSVQKGWFVDSPQTLLKLECQPGEVVTLVPLEQELPAVKHSFTISSFSNSALVLSEASSAYSHSTKHVGSWTKDTAGGNAHSVTYLSNPQFSITLKHKTDISILLEAMNDELNVHFKLVHSGGKRIHSIRNRDIVFDSQDYRRGCCVAAVKDLDPGQYTIVCSTFESNQLGNFTLTVESNNPTNVASLPREGSGRIRLELIPLSFKQSFHKMAIQLLPHRLVKFYAVARCVKQQISSATAPASKVDRSLIRMSIEIAQGHYQKTLTMSNNGEYSSAINGVRTEDIDLAPDMSRSGKVWLVIDRMNASSEKVDDKLIVELFVDQPNAISSGEWLECDD